MFGFWFNTVRERVVGHSLLSRVLEAEAMMAGVVPGAI
jgi:hypothetical protein